MILLFYNFIEVIFWFATVYLAFQTHFSATNNVVFTSGTFAKSIGALYSSFTITTHIGQTGIQARTDWGAITLWVQSIVGVVLILIGLARFLNMLPVPKSNEESRKKSKFQHRARS